MSIIKSKLDFYEHHCHTEYSNLRLTDSLNGLINTIDYAREIGLKGITISDHDCLSGHIKAIQYRKKIRAQGSDFKISLGNEIYLIDEKDYQNTDKFFHFLLIAKDKKGYDQLRKLSTMAWSRSHMHKGMLRVPTFYEDLEEVIGENRGHLIASTACLGSEFAALVSELVALEADNKQEQARSKRREIAELLRRLVSIFGADNFYIEIQGSLSEEQIAYNKRALEIAKHFNIKWLITNDVHFQSKEDFDIHTSFLRSKDGERETESFYSYTYFKTSQELLRLLKTHLSKEDIEAGINNSVLIGEQIEEFDLKADIEIPEIELPDFEVRHHFKEHYDNYEFIKYYAYSPFPQDRYFFYQIEKGFVEKDKPINEETLSRINTELDVVKTISDTLGQRLSAYFNLIKDIIEIAWDEYFGDSLVGISRGSVTGFYTCYLMDIHQLDPIAWDLPYWRFLNKSRTDELPDIDLDFQPSRRPIIFEALKNKYGYENGLNIITFKTESLKSAILTACRGLGIDNAIASDIAASVPVIRGKVLTLDQLLNGDEELELVPNAHFINQVKEHKGLLETISKIEGLVNGFGVHAAGFFIFKDGFLKQNSLMKSPGGQFITCWDLHDSEYTGCLKFDALATDAQDKLRKALDLLVRDGYMEWQGNLWNTYFKYLHPINLDYDNSEMWDKVGRGEIPSLFQFDTAVGGEAIRKVQPRNLKELATSNSLCRITTKDELQPMDKFVLFKNDINLWYQEMKDNGLTEEEQGILKKHLLVSYGICAEQEPTMQLVMDKKITNFTLGEANGIRRAIARISREAMREAKGLFYAKGKQVGTRKEFLDYVWNYCIEPQSGYSFSANHSTPYSAIALQEANLYHFYPSVYWSCAVLTVDASALDEDEEESFLDVDLEEIVSDEETSELVKNLAEKPKGRTSLTNYGKIAKAIGNLLSAGVSMELPDINRADLEFRPEPKNNAIIFGLRGISGINSEVVDKIISEREKQLFKSIADFYERIKPTNTQMYSLIKAGCFDSLARLSRVNTMRHFLNLLAEERFELKDKLTMSNFNKMALANKIPNEHIRAKQMFFFREWTKLQPDGTSKDNFMILHTDERATRFYENRCISEYNPNARTTPYLELEEGYLVYKKPFNSMYNAYMKREVREWLDLEETKEYFYNFEKQEFIDGLWEKYCQGTISAWEMESLNYYYHEHELAKVDREEYKIDNFFALPKEPVILGYTTARNGREYPDYQQQRIMGTVLDRNRVTNHLDLLTPEGVVTVKFYDNVFNFYNRVLRRPENRNGKIVNTTIERSWLTRGNKLVINGIRRGEYFFPRRYFNTDFLGKHTVSLIEEVKDNGRLELKLEREKV